MLSPKLRCFRTSHVLFCGTILDFISCIIMCDKVIEGDGCHMKVKSKTDMQLS